MRHPFDIAQDRAKARVEAKAKRREAVRLAVGVLLRKRPVGLRTCSQCGAELPAHEGRGAKPLTCDEDCKRDRETNERTALRQERAR